MELCEKLTHPRMGTDPANLLPIFLIFVLFFLVAALISGAFTLLIDKIVSKDKPRRKRWMLQILVWSISLPIATSLVFSLWQLGLPYYPPLTSEQLFTHFLKSLVYNLTNTFVWIGIIVTWTIGTVKILLTGSR